MFKELVIEHFRGISYAEFHDLRHINLFLGKNDCGKSSVLEALFLISGLSNPILPYNINVFRGFNRWTEEDVSLLFYGMDVSSPIVIKTNNEETRELRISPLRADAQVNPAQEPDSQSNPAERVFGLQLDFTYNNTSLSSRLYLQNNAQGDSRIERSPEYHEQLFARYVHPGFTYSMMLAKLREIIKAGEKDFVLRGLSSFDPRVCGWDMIRDYVWVDIGIGHLVPINMMGDGIRKVLMIITCIYSCKNGLLLVDEIDNGIHSSMFLKIWGLIISLAKQYNVQVYASTHSLDCLKGFSLALEMFAHDDKDFGRGYFLSMQTDGKMDIEPFSSSQLQYALDNGYDLR